MSWQSQLAHPIVSPGDVGVRFDLDCAPLEPVVARFPMRITPYYFDLIHAPQDPLWRQVIPDVRELTQDGLPEDSLNEEAFSPVPAVIHRYPDRALLLVSGNCAGYCRFCTRKHRIGTEKLCFSINQIEEGIRYIQSRREIRDVILTGGDPLVLEDEFLISLLEKVRRISHVEMVRLGSRIPVTLPQRVTPGLCRQLSRIQPLYLNTHFNHPRELTPDSIRACTRLVEAGVVMGNQTVLLKGVNDDVDVMKRLCRGLLKIRVRPYYLHHLDQTLGTAHFRVAVQDGLALVHAMRGQIAGFGIPQYVIDPPDGQGKVPLTRETVTSGKKSLYLKTSKGVLELPNK